MRYGYMIKTVDKNLQGYKGFQYPKKGLVEAPDWNNKPVCGGGIHGLIHQTKKHYIENKDIWMVLKYIKSEEVIIDNEKIKVPRAWVIGYGSAEEMQALFEKKTGKPYIYDYTIRGDNDYSTLTAGNNSTLIAGYNSTLKTGHSSTLKAGDSSTLTARHFSTLKAGNNSMLEAENNCTLIAGDNSTLTAGRTSLLTAGHFSMLTAGDNSTLKAKYGATLTAGDDSMLKVGNDSTLKAGDNSVCMIQGRQCTVEFTGQVTLIFAYTKKHYIVSKEWDGRKYKIYLKDNKIVEELMKEE